MSYFAILGEEPKSFVVARCHVNLWLLNGLGGRPVFYMDVGIGINAAAIPKGLSLVLPVGVSPDDFKDLREPMERNANLIFGEPVNVVDHVLSEPSMHLQVLRATRSKDSSGDDYSVWELKPMNWKPGAENYFRARFRLTSLNRSWMTQRSGAILDLRLCDVRESASFANLSGLDAQIVHIERLNLFAILPASLKCRWVSPAPAHIRMLEGEVWSDYLGRKKTKLSRHKLAVYYWKGVEIDARKPFRAFLDLAEERAVLGWQPYAFAIVGIALFLCARHLTLSQILAEAKVGLNWFYTFLTVSGIAVVKAFARPLMSLIRSTDRIKKAFRSVEARWFNVS